MALAAALTVTGCTGSTTVGSTGTVALTTAPPPRPASRTAVSPTPVTPDGMVTGPGVTDTTITLGLIEDPSRDRGFADGVRLWRDSVDAAGGICGRRIAVRTSAGLGAADAYRGFGRSVLGFAALISPTDRAALVPAVSADETTVLEVGDSSAALTTRGPIALGATDDLQTINALAYLASTGSLHAGSRLGVIADATPDAANALRGAQWWAARNSVELEVRTAEQGSTGGWGTAAAVLVLAGPGAARAALLAAGGPVVTLLDGYDPAMVPAGAGHRWLVALQTPAFGSDQPAAAAVARAFVDRGGRNPGSRLLAGYAIGRAWGRLLDQACGALTLTRTGVLAALAAVGPAPVDSLFGPSDPGIVVSSALPATRVSSMAVADPSAPAGLTPLIWSQAAAGIGDYTPGA